MYDNPIAWGVLLMLSFILMLWFGNKCFKEIDKNLKEQEEYWEKKENEK